MKRIIIFIMFTFWGVNGWCSENQQVLDHNANIIVETQELLSKASDEQKIRILKNKIAKSYADIGDYFAQSNELALSMFAYSNAREFDDQYRDNYVNSVEKALKNNQYLLGITGFLVDGYYVASDMHSRITGKLYTLKFNGDNYLTNIESYTYAELENGMLNGEYFLKEDIYCGVYENTFWNSSSCSSYYYSGTYKNNQKNGRFHEEFYGGNTNFFTYENDVLNGKFFYITFTKQLGWDMETGTYKNGLLHGKFYSIQLYESEVFLELNYINGKIEGPFSFYEPSVDNDYVSALGDMENLNLVPLIKGTINQSQLDGDVIIYTYSKALNNSEETAFLFFNHGELKSATCLNSKQIEFENIDSDKKFTLRTIENELPRIQQFCQ